MTNEVTAAVHKAIRVIAEQRRIILPPLKDATEIVDELGFSSLTVAALIASLEEEFGIDPFQEDDVMITDVRTIRDLCNAYAGCLERSK